jgi:hypothetical protein
MKNRQHPVMTATQPWRIANMMSGSRGSRNACRHVGAVGAALVPAVLAIASFAFALPDSAATVVWPSAAIPDLKSGQPPTAEDFNGRFYVATVTDVPPEEARFQISSTPLNLAAPVWTTQLLQSPSDPGSSLAIKVWRSRLWLAFRAQNNRKIYVTSSKNGTTWNAWEPVPDSDHDELGRGGVSLKGFGESLYLATRTTNGGAGVELTARTRNGRWTPFSTVPESALLYSPALTEFNDLLTVAIVGLDGQLHINHSPDGRSWGSWIDAPALGFDEDGTTPLVASSGPGITVYHGRLYVAVRIGDFDVAGSRLTATFDGSTWSAWSPDPPPAPTIRGEPSLTTADDDLFLTSQDWDNGVRVERISD